MKFHLLKTYLPILFFLCIFASCEKNEFEQQKNKFDKSYQSWISFKETSGNSYRYMVTSSSWTGSSSQTLITVKDGKIIERYHKQKFIDGVIEHLPDSVLKDVNKAGELEWTEYEGEINSHEPTAAANPLTLDQIYDMARKEWVVKRENADLFFEANNNGLISSCGYVEDGCQDDCFTGIKIASIAAL